MTSNDLSFARWDVVLTPFPFTDKRSEKRRPALVISNVEFSKANQQIIAVMITSAAKSAWPDDRAIEDLESAGLPKKCVVRWKVFTLPNEMVIKRLGQIAVAERGALTAKIAELFLA